MDGYFFYKLAEHMKKGTKYTLQDIDNLVSKVLVLEITKRAGSILDVYE